MTGRRGRRRRRRGGGQKKGKAIKIKEEGTSAGRGGSMFLIWRGRQHSVFLVLILW
jgi:hypothetical protein